MTTFAEEKTKIRRFLRDPDSNIWSDMDILTYWNDSQMEISNKIGFIEKANSYKFPPEWSTSYQNDWEYQYATGDRYRCLIEWQAGEATVCYPWEPGYFLDSSDTFDNGYRFTQPWEGVQSGSPADIIPIPLHERFNNMKFLAYDEQELSPVDRRLLSNRNGFYRTTTGTAQNYWRPDTESETIVLYPRPSNVTFDDGSIDDTADDAGGVNTWTEAALDESDRGIITETLDTEDKLFSVFEYIPADVPEDPGDWSTEQIDFPAFMVKYIRHATLERCFGADTDGFIPSLRDYWQQRKEVGIKAVRRYKNMRRQDRAYRLGGSGGTYRTKHPRLPASYPAQ